MVNNPRLTIELVEKGGGKGQTSVPFDQGSSNIPGSSLADDFQKRVSEQGAAGFAGSPVAPSPMPSDHVGTALDNQSRSYIKSPRVSDFDNSNPYSTIVAAAYQTDPSITAETLSKTGAFQGLSRDEIQGYLDQAAGNSSRNTPPPPPPPAPPSSLPSPDDDGYRLAPSEDYELQPYIDEATRPPKPTPLPPPPQDLERFADRVVNSVKTDQEKHQEHVGRLQEALQAGLLTQQQHDLATQQASSMLPQNRPMDAEVVEDASPRKVASSVSNIIANLPGGSSALGNFAQSMLAAAPSLLPSGATGSAIAATAGPIGAGLAVGAAGLALAASPFIVAANESYRVRALAGYLSPELAQAEAEGELRQVMANFQTARNLGKVTADYVETTSRLSTATQGIRDFISEPIISEVSDALKVVTVPAEAFNKYLEDNEKSKRVAQGATKGVINGLVGLAGLLPGLGRWLDGGEKEAKDPLAMWFDNDYLHLVPPAPFNDLSADEPMGVGFAPIAGLKF